jgi:radical SAM superfamily enzyme YgiQ (UPF0313 family)
MGRQPLGLAVPLGFLRRAGLPAAGIDLSVESLAPESIDAAELVGIAVPMHTALRIGVGAARQIRQQKPAARIVFLGLYAGLNAAWLLEEGHADFIIAGEVEEPLVELARAVLARPARLPSIPGVATPARPLAPLVRLRESAVPHRAGLPPLSRYAHLHLDAGTRRPAGAVEASRGCKHLCRHCPLTPFYKGRFFIVPQEIILADIEKLVEQGAEHVTFADPDFLNGPAHALAAIQAAHRRFPALSFDVTAKIEHLLDHADLLPVLAGCRCLFVVSAVESLNDTVLEILEKGHTRADVYRALEIVRGAGMTMRPSFMPFTPWAGLDDYLDLLEFIDEEDLVDAVDPIQLAIRLLVPPGSALEQSEAMRPHLRGLSREDFAWIWEHPDPRMDRLQERIMAIVTESAGRREDPALTYRRIAGVAMAIAGEEAGAAGRQFFARLPPPHRRRPPRLTEPWFC